MAKKLTLPDHDFSIDPKDVNERLSYQSFLDNIHEPISKNDLETSILNFEIERSKLKTAMQHSLKILREQPLLTAFLVWSKNNLVGSGFPDYAKKLFDKKIIKFSDAHEHLIPIKQINNKEIKDTLDEIRCRKDIEVWEREMLVLCYLDFMNWVRAVTFNSILETADPDKQKTLGRWLDYDVFIRLLTKLDDRCQLVAKLLFFGGSRVLAEILNLDIREIDFEKRLISYDTYRVSYPGHVFEDIKKLVGKRDKGKVFLGKNKTSLNAATIFRNFKEAASQISFEGEFSPKILTMNI